MVKIKTFKLYDYNVYDGYTLSKNTTDIPYDKYKDNKFFIVQMFGINSLGHTASILVEGFNPFFYIKVDDVWNESLKNEFISYLRQKMGRYYEDSIIDAKLEKKHKLYLFDNHKLHNFIKISFTNVGAFNRAKNLFYIDNTINGEFSRTLKKDGIIYGKYNCYLYEATIPPLLKLFHIKEFSPSGWIRLPNNKVTTIEKANKTTYCTYEYIINYKDIEYLNKDDIVKYNICSFDIEASSSHGDFPVPIKNYKKLATDILEYYNNLNSTEQSIYSLSLLKQQILSAFGYNYLSYISKVYPKKSKDICLDENEINNRFDKFINYVPAKDKEKYTEDIDSFLSESESENDDDINNDIINGAESCNNELDSTNINTYYYKKSKKIKQYKKPATIFDIIKDDKCEYDIKLNELTKALSKIFPPLEGDIVTFIGLSFINYGDTKPSKRILIVKGGCKIPEKYKQWSIDNNVHIIKKSTEKGVLLEFTKIIQKENPHIITGYNITGFDFDFMFKRSQELECTNEFLKLSKNRNDICIKKNWKTEKDDIESNKIILASGEYNLKFIKMPGRIIIDMCVIFRREFTLSSNKLDYVSSYFISDSVKNAVINIEDNTTTIYSKNLTGLTVGCYIKFDEISYSVNSYKKGKKFEVLSIDIENSSFVIDACEELDLEKYKINWGLAKDDVSPQEIFSLSNGTDYDRWTVGKYCLADCDNVIWLLNKIDVITDKVEMSNLCDVPLSYLLQRGQGIKLQSYVSKKCGEKNTLMPVIEKNMDDGGYEGAHVFSPKTGLYLEDPVACVDYSSLYPSSMISENISHDSKVWTKEYDLSGNLISCTGEQDNEGKFIYDNLEEYKYVDIKYDTYKYIRTTAKSAAKKVIDGYKICRYAQFQNGKAIMPAILEELLAARKATKKLMGKEEEPFKKNIYDKRQLSIKVTANSLYGQCGAKTSAFYEKDVAASTTAIGRKLLFYGRHVIEGCYNNIEVKVNDGTILIVKAECVYGDTDSVFFKFNLRDLNTGERIINKRALIYTIELAKEAGKLATKFLKQPHDLEYEKTFWPFNLLSKKRYDGMLYEEDPEKCKLKSMGNVLKRRDNAPIVKDIYGGVVEILMKDKSLSKAINFVHVCLENMIQGKYPLEKLVVTKSLRGYYKNPKQIAHKVLAERIGLRENGNKPGAGDRINYAYIKTENKKALQGDKIETPEFIRENNLPLDYGHYISNQIMKPLLQLFALELENMKEFRDKQFYIKEYNDKKTLTWEQDVSKLREKWPEPEKFIKKYEELRCKEVKSLIFDKYLKELK